MLFCPGREPIGQKGNLSFAKLIENTHYFKEKRPFFLPKLEMIQICFWDETFDGGGRRFPFTPAGSFKHLLSLGSCKRRGIGFLSFIDIEVTGNL
jgi:hypothetical protein